MNNFCKNIIVIISIIIGSCNTGEESQHKSNSADKLVFSKEESEDIKRVNIDYLKDKQTYLSIVNQKTEYTVFTTLDVDCSYCIVTFLELLDSFNKQALSSNKIKYVFIAFSDDLSIIHYYMDLFDVELKDNQLLLTDLSQSFLKNNQFVMKDYMDILLTDYDYRVIVRGNPLESETVFKIYSNLGILSTK